MNLEADFALRHRWVGLLVLACALLVGCKTLEKTPAEVVTPKVPAQFRHVEQPNPDASPLLRDAWWTRLGDAELAPLIERALRDNPDIKIADLQIVQAQARAKGVQAGGRPTVSVPMVMATQSSASPVGSAPVSGERTRQTVLQASVQAAWRVDIWGEQSAREASADLQVQRATFERDNVRRNVIGSLLSVYVMALSLNDAIRNTEEIVRSSEALLRVVEQRFQVQDATITELEQQRAALALQRTVLPVLRQQQEDIRSQMGLLLGTTTDQVPWPAAGLEGVALPSVNAGLPSALLLRRPDVRMMEARLRAARADVDVARAQFLPPLDLSFQAGQSAQRLAQLLRPEALFWSAVGSITAAVFDGGRREAQTEEAQAFYEEMVLTYGKVIHQALREVEGALSLVRNAAERFESQQQALGSARAVFRAAQQAYAVGALDAGSLADARRSYQRQHDDMLRSKAEALRANVSLAQALAVL